MKLIRIIQKDGIEGPKLPSLYRRGSVKKYRCISDLEELPINQRQKRYLYNNFSYGLIKKAVEHYYIKKKEMDDPGEFIKKICTRHLEKKK